MDTFPHPQLTPIVGKLNAHSLLRLRREHTANAMFVPSIQGGGTRGHLLALLLNAAEYLIASGGHAFIAPAHPGAAPAHPVGSTNAQIHAANTAYKRTLAEFHVYNNTRNEFTYVIRNVARRYYVTWNRYKAEDGTEYCEQ